MFLGAWHLTYIFDSSYDGMWYHQEAVIQFAKGWNPFKQLPAKEWGSPLGVFYDTHYPKAAWMAEAVVYQFTHRIESAKIIQVSTTIGLFFTTFSFCLQWRFLSWVQSCFHLSNLFLLPRWPTGCGVDVHDTCVTIFHDLE